MATIVHLAGGPVVAWAEARAASTEVSAFAGASLLDAAGDAEASGIPRRRSIDGSVVVGIRAARIVRDRARFELRLAVAPSHELTSEFATPCEAPVCPTPPPTSVERATLVAYHYGIGGSLDLTGGRVRPYLGLGVGGVSYAASGEVDTALAFTVGGGLKVDFGRFGVQLEVSDEVVPNHFLTGDAQHDVHLLGGFLIRLR